ncbi:MAG: large-conductance mechanosensitive channel protein MscL [Porphyromonas somerae]|uniref:large-conductance mechanosensitive channel protein MscL n=1 Tax=Porphyromonas somerae TaxID=322095 RepID=UPI0026EDAC43|nr:large-conductance mechanosensitive channel protein MscL [Porphyromonas somerae]MDD7557729.1 large-conductance mechanosensitive channel protein MscL [Porphyromonas somerae]MDY3120450.1 large-conductance mechanosensitive channel protein MscL [Porphyromonas somerae]MDY3883717.1 large-conductance mechanosensitive channel protein MscL [Porphyromonas somerae]MDY5814834.1 large-conductance mechanosensitive channel protein MscL [Porphyromonas somerae]
MAFFEEFKEFVSRGNVLDMAVGVVIGGAFGKIVSSVVNDILMPPIGLLLGGVDFSDLKVVLQSEQVNELGEVIQPLVTLNYGSFIQTVVDFLIIALAIFTMIKGVNKLKRAEEEKPAEEPAAKSDDVVLLEEIRDLLKKQ